MQRNAKSRVWMISLATVLSLAAGACSASGDNPPEAIALRGPDGELLQPGDTIGTPLPATAPEPTASTQPEVSTDAPVDDSTSGKLPVSNDELRVTADDVSITTYNELFDFGNGPEDSWWLQAEHSSGSLAGATIFDQAADADVLDVENWASSNGTMTVVRVAVGPEVTEVQLHGGNGQSDRVAPDARQFANLAVRDDINKLLTIEALDANGTVLGTCTFNEDLFSRCPG